MSVTAQRALRTAIEHRTFDRVYYLHGDDEFRKDDAVARVIAAAVDPATSDFNCDRFRGAETDAGLLSGALDALPMLAERRVVVVRDVGALRKQARSVLDRYVQSPSPDVVLVLTSLAGDQPEASLASRATQVPFPALDEERLVGWLVRYASERGVQLTEDDCRMIATGVGGELALAVAEIEKLLSFTSGRAVTADDVRAVVGVQRGESVDVLLDAIAERDLGKALALVHPVLSQPGVTAVAVVSNLAAQMLGIGVARGLVDSGLRGARLENELFNLIKSTRAFVGRSYTAAARCWARAVSGWRADEIAAAVRLLRDADLTLKSSTLTSNAGVLEALLMEMLPLPARARVA
jgi:DNA polymerase-3 subunit delta